MTTQTLAADRPELNEDQEAAAQAIIAWLNDPTADRFYLLSAPAGTGKTFMMRRLVDRVKGRFVFTAPTNKAVKVLRGSLTDDKYFPECRTIYSVLGLRLEANGEVKELAEPDDPIDLSHYACIVVDEGSMLSELVLRHIKSAAERYKIKILFLGDPAQLNPVKERVSPVFKIEAVSTLTKVMRHDNQILNLVTRIRGVVNHPAPRLDLAPDHSADEGVWRLQEGKFEDSILQYADRGAFMDGEKAKVIAWRNVTVDRYNNLIRRRILGVPVALSQPWHVGERVIFTAPARDLDDEPMASTDDEGEITSVAEDEHPIYREFGIWRISITLDTNKLVVARVLHERDAQAFTQRVERLAAEARSDRRRWPAFWDFKDSFHSLRYAYAITAHRSQGSTYENVFADWRDILVNQNKAEAYRCLYVAASRAKKRLFLN